MAKKKNKKQSHQSRSMQTSAVASNPSIDGWYYRILLVASFVTPLFFSTLFTNTFELSKMAVLYVLAFLALVLTMFNWLRHKSIYLPSTVLNLPILAFLAALGSATIFSIHPYTSIVGGYTRINGGLASYVTYIIFFYTTVMALRPLVVDRSIFLEERRRVLLWTWCVSAGLVGLIGALQHFGLDLTCVVKGQSVFDNCWTASTSLRVYATLTHPNLMAAYMAMIIPVTVMLLVTAQSFRARVFALVVSSLCYAALWYAYSRSGLIGLGVGITLLVLLTPWSALKSKWRWLASLVVICVIISTTAFSLTALRTESLFEDAPISESTATTRFLVWESALGVFQDHPVLGIGPATFGYKFPEYRPDEFNTTMEWSNNFDKVHNQVLGMMVSAGLIGLVSWLSLFVALVWYIWRQGLLGNLHRLSSKISWLKRWSGFSQIENEANNQHSYSSIALLAGIAGLLVAQLFGFSSVTSNLLMYIALAIIVVPAAQYRHVSLRPAWRFYIALLLIATLLAGLGFGLSRYLQANMSAKSASYYATATYGDMQSTMIGLQRSVEGYEKAIERNPLQPRYYLGMANTYFRIAGLLQDADQKEQLLTAGDLYLDKAKNMLPIDIELLAGIGSAYYQMGSLDPQFYPKAIDIILRVKAITPKAPNVYSALGNAYLANNQHDKSLVAFNELVSLMPENASFYLNRAEYWKAVNDTKNMELDIAQALDLAPKDKTILKKVEELRQGE